MRRKPNNKMSRRRFRGDNNVAKIKNAAANRDKYQNLAREAMAGGDRIEAENYLQHAEHYYRVLSVLQEEDARYRAEQRQYEQQQDTADTVDDDATDAPDDELTPEATDKAKENMALAG